MLERWPMKLQLKVKIFLTVEMKQNWPVMTGYIYGFMKRHSDLSLRKPKACSLSRVTDFNKHTVAAFFEKLKNVYDCNVELLMEPDYLT